MHTFGAGVLIGTQTQDAAGNAIALGSPIQFGILQEVTFDEDFELKELYGANQFPVDVGRGKGKVMLKAKFANINAELYNAFVYGLSSINTGYATIFQDLTGTAVPGTAGATSVIVVPPSTGIFQADLGVQDGNGIPFTRVASSPTGGQYNTTGATGGTSMDYQFSNQDVGRTVFINYEYSNASLPAAAKNFALINQPMGYAPVFQVDLMAQMHGKTYYVRFPNAISTKLSRTFKNDDFTIPEMDISCFADSTGHIHYSYFSE